jgi:hypothetical protein
LKNPALTAFNGGGVLIKIEQFVEVPAFTGVDPVDHDSRLIEFPNVGHIPPPVRAPAAAPLIRVPVVAPPDPFWLPDYNIVPRY